MPPSDGAPGAGGSTAAAGGHGAVAGASGGGSSGGSGSGGGAPATGGQAGATPASGAGPGGGGAGGRTPGGPTGPRFGLARFAPPFGYASEAGADGGTQLLDTDSDGVPELVRVTGEKIEVAFFAGGVFRSVVSSPLGARASTARFAPGPSVALFTDLDADGHPDAVIGGDRFADGLDRVLLGRGDGTFSLGPATHLLASLPLASPNVLSGDLNGDGFVDILAVYADEFAVALGKGGGTFGAGTRYPAVGVSWWVWAPPLLVDFNGDKRLDLVLGDTLYANDGRGTFSKPTVIAPGHATMAAIDLNDDTQPDLIATELTNGEGGGLSVLINRAGTLETPKRYLEGRLVSRVEAADLDGDKRPDLIVATRDQFGASPDDGLFVLMNRAGSLSEPVNLYPGTGAAQVDSGEPVLVGDLNGDGRPDIVTSRAPAGDVTMRLKVLFNLGQGGFAAPVPLPATGTPAAIVDIDRDGDADLFVDDGCGLLLNGDSGGFTETGRVPLPVDEARVSAWADVAHPPLVDLDGDGALDVVFRGVEGIFTVRGHGDGTLDMPVELTRNLGAPNLAAADLTGDGRPEIVVPLDTPGGGVAVLANDGRGRFASLPVTYPTPGYAHAVAVADFRAAGVRDVAVLVAGAVTVLGNDGRGRLAAPVTYALDRTYQSIIAVDLDGDGPPELVLEVGSRPGDVAPQGAFQILHNDGPGTFTPRAPVTFEGRGLAWADVTGDGLPDHVVVSKDGEIRVFANTAGAIGTAPARSLTPLRPVFAAFGAELSGDRRGELVTIGRFLLPRGLYASVISFFASDASGTGAPVAAYAIAHTAISVGDMNGDGRPDLVIGDERGLSVMSNVNAR